MTEALLFLLLLFSFQRSPHQIILLLLSEDPHVCYGKDFTLNALTDTTLPIYPGSGLRLVVPWPVDPCDIMEQEPC